MRWTVDLHSPGTDHDLYCVEAFAAFGTQQKLRILHFGVQQPLRQEDVDFISSRVEEAFRGLVIRNIGCQIPLEF